MTSATRASLLHRQVIRLSQHAIGMGHREQAKNGSPVVRGGQGRVTTNRYLTAAFSCGNVNEGNVDFSPTHHRAFCQCGTT
jgi:hypothetical protein